MILKSSLSFGCLIQQGSRVRISRHFDPTAGQTKDWLDAWRLVGTVFMARFAPALAAGGLVRLGLGAWIQPVVEPRFADDVGVDRVGEPHHGKGGLARLGRFLARVGCLVGTPLAAF